MNTYRYEKRDSGLKRKKKSIGLPWLEPTPTPKKIVKITVVRVAP